MLSRSVVALALLLAACPGSSSKPEPTTGSSTGSSPGSATGGSDGSATSSDAPPAPPTGPKIGESCGPGDTCGEGTCVKFFGIAGARGPELKQCEIKCDGKVTCPDGRKCITIADGPGQVCR
jgi:hypothetical protein